MINNPVRKLSDIKVIEVLCGKAWEISTAADTERMSIAVVEVLNAPKHVHRKMTEFYYILEGEGKVELDGNIFDVNENTTVIIEPNVKHSIRSAQAKPLKLIAITTPAFDRADEFPV